MSTQQSGEGDMLLLIICVCLCVCPAFVTETSTSQLPKILFLVLVEKINKNYEADLNKIGLAFN